MNSGKFRMYYYFKSQFINSVDVPISFLKFIIMFNFVLLRIIKLKCCLHMCGHGGFFFFHS